jgi:hypothetical protein
MSHPAVLECAAQTAEANRQFLVIDNRFAASQCESVEMVLRSREAIAQSHVLLDELKDAHLSVLFWAVSNPSIVSTSSSDCRSRSVRPAAGAGVTLSVASAELLLRALWPMEQNKNPAEWPGRGLRPAATPGEETRLGSGQPIRSRALSSVGACVFI